MRKKSQRRRSKRSRKRSRKRRSKRHDGSPPFQPRLGSHNTISPICINKAKKKSRMTFIYQDCYLRVGLQIVFQKIKDYNSIYL